MNSWGLHLNVSLTPKIFLEVSALGQMSKVELMAAQKQDPVIGPTIQALTHNTWPEEVEVKSDLIRMKREQGRLHLRDGRHHCQSKTPSGEVMCQLVLPTVFRGMVLKSLQDDTGHVGIKRTTDLIRTRPRTAGDTEQYIKNCITKL